MGILFSIFLIGFTAMAAQIIILRELLIVFYGNEVSIGLILGSWLFWGAAGSWFLGSFTDSFDLKPGIFPICQLILTFFLVSSILIIRSIKFYFGLAPGEVIGFMPMAISTFFVLAPICALLGFMFSLGCKIYQAKEGETGRNIGLAYGWESIGAMLGGLLSSFIFVRFLNSVTIAVVLGILNISAAAFLQFKLRKTGGAFLLVILAMAFGLSLFKAAPGLDEYSRRRQWRGYQILESRNSIYGNVMVTKINGQYSFFDNGLHLYSIPDRQAAEEAVHFTLLEHPDPRDVLLLGGGPGQIREILQYPVGSIDYLELDPLIIKMAEKYLPPEEYVPLRDARVSIHNLDARFFIKSSNKKYDCVIACLGDPYTAQINRYYTIEFFEEIKKLLRKNGIFSFALSSSESYISPELSEYLSSVYLGLKEVFGDILVIPGDTAYFLASDMPGVITSDYRILMDKAKERGIDLKYVREYYLFSKLSPRLVDYTKNTLLQRKEVRLNYDFHPSSYYYNMIFWSLRLGEPGFKKLFKSASFKNTVNAVSGICILIIVMGLAWTRRNKRVYKYASLMALMAAGFSAMAIQIITLLAFQIIYGYVFYKVGFLLTFFMAGLATGSFWVTGLINKLKRPLNILTRVNSLFFILSLGLPLFFSWLSASDNMAVSQAGANLAFPLLSFIIGLLAGVQFASANKVYIGDIQKVGTVSGMTYGIDLLGSCFGALLTSIFLIPVLGVSGSCFAIAALNLSVLTILSLAVSKPLIS